MLSTAAMDCAYIMTPILAVPKYMMHRHLIKRMHHKLGDKARVAHCTWTEHNFITTAHTTDVSLTSSNLQQQSLTSPSKRLGQRPKRSLLSACCFCTGGSAVDAEP